MVLETTPDLKYAFLLWFCWSADSRADSETPLLVISADTGIRLGSREMFLPIQRPAAPGEPIAPKLTLSSEQGIWIQTYLKRCILKVRLHNPAQDVFHRRGSTLSHHIDL